MSLSSPAVFLQRYTLLLLYFTQIDDDDDDVLVCRCQTRSWSHTMQRCPSTSWLRTRTRHTALTTRLCTTSASVPSSWPLPPTVTSTTLSLQPCLVSPLVSASQARLEFNSSLSGSCCAVIGIGNISAVVLRFLKVWAVVLIKIVLMTKF